MDQIDRELTAALSVEPSPEFRARVRARIATEPATLTWHLGWRFASAGIAVLAVVIALTVVRLDVTDNAPRSRVQTTARTSPPAAEMVDSSASVPVRHAHETIARRRSPRTKGPEVLVATGEVRALRQLMEIVRDGRTRFVFGDDIPPVESALSVARDPVKDIVIAPIEIAPINVATNAESVGN